MRLTHIKLAGFKSFVDPTTVPFPSNLTAIVGPNGCGKSNIIDAVRWVMGESSAKQLRGESLDDVIFNGSTGRKPLGQAAIELCFDNSAGVLGGQYAGYSEIAIRREITRDGQSNYYLNGTKCRRRDITDLFLGTGLGPRSYAIIEQGMISRLVEAKPEELRNYLEEVAGISKYKERKHETELRIHHTQENLARINDLCDELARQLNHLQKQANAAEKYQVLKQEERLLKAQLLALRWRSLNERLIAEGKNIQDKESALNSTQNTLQEIITLLAQQREQQTQVNHHNNAVQARYYELGAEVSRLEQAIQHQNERREQAQIEQVEIIRSLDNAKEQLMRATEQAKELVAEVVALEPVLQQAKQTSEKSQQTLNQSEHALREWHAQWDHFNREAAQTTQQAQVNQTQIQHLEQRLTITQQRIDRLEQEHQTIQSQPVKTDDIEKKLTLLQMQYTEGEQQLQNLLQEIAVQREANKQTSLTLDQTKSRLQTLQGQQASLEALQKAALEKSEGTVADWLAQRQISDKPRLAHVLQVEAGWEAAVEVVLNNFLQAVCLDDLAVIDFISSGFPKGNLQLITQPKGTISSIENKKLPTLLEKVQAPFSLSALLSQVYVCETLTEALHHAVDLSQGESIVTRNGIWLGDGWLRVTPEQDAKSGVLQRKRELAELTVVLQETVMNVEQLQTQFNQGQQQLHLLEQKRDHKQHEQVALIATQAELRAQQQVQQAHITQVTQRGEQIKNELHECAQQLLHDQKLLAETKEKWQQAQQLLAAQTHQREELLQIKDNCQTTVDSTRQQAKQDQEAVHQCALRLQAAKLQLDTTQQNQARLQQQLQELQKRQEFLQQLLQENNEPLAALTQQWQDLTEQRRRVSDDLTAAKQQAEQITQLIRQTEENRQRTEEAIQIARDVMEKTRMAAQSLEVRASTLQEQLTEHSYELTNVLEQLPPEAQEEIWEQNVAQVTRRIERLGPINLAAIEEYNAQAERKNYLDAQHADLSEALAALESAMQKMDRETRVRFQETFDKVNAHFQTLFPGLFGGGKASLELLGDDLLTTGITLMAQPPGKRNSTIHLLSGGEKALTAMALVFSLFQLNPAPFCILDEVDAPLDDANVGRFCNLVKEMSNKVQFIFISHNKLAIEMAEHLAGVTMQEAGVSRMVAVDIEAAMAMAEA